MNVLLYVSVIIGFFFMGLNSICGFIAYSLAKKRNIQALPAFFAALLGSIGVVFIVAMFPKKQESQKKFPKLDF